MKTKMIFIFIASICVVVCLYYAYKVYMSAPIYLYKVVTGDTLRASEGKENLVLPSFDDAFIHFATKEQVPKIIKKFFKNQSNIHILKLDVARLPGRLIRERNFGGQTKYYHLYDGAIPKAAIVEQKQQ